MYEKLVSTNHLGNRQMRVESTVFLDVATHRQEKHAWNKHFGVILVTFIR